MRTARHTDKDELIADIITMQEKLLAAACRLAPGQQNQVFLGIWCVKDILAHLVGWDHANLEALQAVRAGRLPEFYAFIDKDWKTYNAQLVAKYRLEDLTELVSSVRAAHKELIDRVKSIPADELDRDFGVRFKGYRVTIARLLQAELKDEKVHLAQIENFFMKD